MWTDACVVSTIWFKLDSSIESVKRNGNMVWSPHFHEYNNCKNDHHSYYHIQSISTPSHKHNHAIIRDAPTNRHTSHFRFRRFIPQLNSVCTVSCRNAVSGILSLSSVNTSPMLSLLYLVILSIVFAQCWDGIILSWVDCGRYSRSCVSAQCRHGSIPPIL